MSLILELRDRVSHAGVPLVHPTSEHVVLANVFGLIKNLSFDAVVNPWLEQIAGDEIAASDDWKFSFWEKQPEPVGIQEGSTEVDLVLSSSSTLLFVEVKMDAAPSAGPSSHPERNQLIRNLDIGTRRAEREKKRLAVIYITLDMNEPEIVGRIRSEVHRFPTTQLFWSSWAMIADILAQSFQRKKLHPVEQKFALDLLAYLAKKGLWQNTLSDDPTYYGDKLYRSLRATNSPFIPYSDQGIEADETWRINDWDEAGLREFLRGLRWEDKVLLKLLAEAGGVIRQDRIMQAIPFLRGKTSGSLASLKSHINRSCKGHGKAPLLAEGKGSKDQRVHEINPQLGELRRVVIEEAKAFVVPEGEREQSR